MGLPSRPIIGVDVVGHSFDWSMPLITYMPPLTNARCLLVSRKSSHRIITQREGRSRENKKLKSEKKISKSISISLHKQWFTHPVSSSPIPRRFMFLYSHFPSLRLFSPSMIICLWNCSLNCRFSASGCWLSFWGLS